MREHKALEEMTASVHDGNVAACRFFDRLGFQVKRTASDGGDYERKSGTLLWPSLR